jgi:hypothetical protein
MCKLYVGSPGGASSPRDRRRVAPHMRLEERRWPNFILWRWAGPAQGGWIHCPRNPPRLPLPRPHDPSISMSRLPAGRRLVARPPGRFVAPPARPPSQPGVRRARLPAKVGKPPAGPVEPPSAQPASPVGPPGAPLVRPPAKVVGPLVKGPGQLSAPRERVPAGPGGQAGADRLSLALPARRGPRRS